ncbi:MAG: amino acid adenylation domain-containing protein [candidate division KSB1 bacterium]|nr:amino acid adenylation domain-containing protein [candidate division KSB1 bacterium]
MDFNLLPRSAEYTAYPLSAGQKALWFLQQLNPSTTAYSITWAMRTEESLDIQALSRVLQKLVDRHAALRTTFISHQGQPVQIVHHHKSAGFFAVDASGWNEHQLKEAINEQARQPFDLAAGPLLRVHLFSRSNHDHTFLVSAHHIITDLWSFALFFNEFETLYASELQGIPVELPPLKIEYTDYVYWQSKLLASEQGEKLWNYWQKVLEGDLPIINLPIDHPRPTVQSFDGAIQSAKFSAELKNKLRAMGERYNASLYRVLMAAFQVLLYRYTDQTDIIVGSPIAGRNKETFNVLGYFVNPLPIRGDLSGHPQFSDVLEQMNQRILTAIEHGEYPFPLMVEKLQLKRNSSITPIFQVMLTYQKTTKVLNKDAIAAWVLREHGRKGMLAGIHFEYVTLQHLMTQFDLTMFIAEHEDGLAIAIEYNSALFKKETIQRMLGHFQKLLETVAANPEQSIDRIQIMQHSELQQLQVWNARAKIKKPSDCNFIHRVFEAQVNNSPSATALILDHHKLNYDELNRRANRLAHYLISLGVAPETVVGVYLERSIDLIIALMAVFKSGGVFLPLDPSYPSERISFMLADADAQIIITMHQLAGSLLQSKAKIIALDQSNSIIDQQDDQNPDVKLYPENLAYIIYTSGSTGLPKGVQISHGAIAEHCEHIAHHYQIRAEDRVLQFASINFDAALEQILVTLLSGAQLLLRGKEIWSPIEFYRRIYDFQLTVVNPPTSYWNQMLNEVELFSSLDIPGHLRLMIVGGDVMTSERFRIWQHLANDRIRLLNAYGPTETTITATTFETSSLQSHSDDLTTIPIGQPVIGREIFILDRAQNMVPIGVVGELYIAGTCLARGYLNRPDLTAERFIPHPFSNVPGERLYRTGDLVRFRSDGIIEFIGRADHQVKIRGFRVELGEIQSALQHHPAIKDLVVIVAKSSVDDKTLAAYLSLNRESESLRDPHLWRTFLQDKLPEYMIPFHFIFVDEIPRHPNGKVDQSKLPDISSASAIRSSDFVAPRTPIEQQLAALWSQLLGIESIGIYDNFFTLGGHSLLATQMVSRVRDIFQIEIPLQKIFETPTIAGLALAITQFRAQLNQNEQLDQLLFELEQLSDAEAENLLNATLETAR